MRDILAQATPLWQAKKKKKTTTPSVQGRPYYQAAAHAQAMTHAKLAMGARLLFEELVRACGSRPYTWVLQRELADRLGVTPRTVQRYERALIAAGLLSVARVSLWARWLPGGSRRVAVPHVFDGARLVCPYGVLDDDGKLLAGEGVAVKAVVAKRREGVATTVSPQWRKRSSYGDKRKTCEPRRPETLPGAGLGGSLRAQVEDAANYAAFLLEVRRKAKVLA